MTSLKNHYQEKPLNHPNLVADAAERAIRAAHLKDRLCRLVKIPEAWVVLISGIYLAVRILPAVWP